MDIVPLYLIVVLYFLLATCKVVVTADQGVRGGKVIELKRTVDIAVAECNCVENVFVMSRTGAEVPMQSGRDIKLDEVSTECPIFVLQFQKILRTKFYVGTLTVVQNFSMYMLILYTVRKKTF